MASAAALCQAHKHSSAARMARTNFQSFAADLVGSRRRACGDPGCLSLWRELLVWERRCVGDLDDDKSVVGRRMAGVASFRQALIGLVELTAVLEFDGIVEKRQRLGHGCIDQIGYRQAFPASGGVRHYVKTLPEVLQHGARQLRVPGVA